jgi:hypothetical protein
MLPAAYPIQEFVAGGGGIIWRENMIAIAFPLVAKMPACSPAAPMIEIDLSIVMGP